MTIVNAIPHYWTLLDPLPANIKVNNGDEISEFIHGFVHDMEELSSLFSLARSVMAQDGMLWVSWPKKSSGIQTLLHRDIIREYGLSEGYVDVKVAAINETWSGLKFVYRLKDRIR